MTTHVPAPPWNLTDEAEFASVDVLELIAKHDIQGQYAFYGWSVRKGWVPIIEQMFGDLIEAGWDRTGLMQIKQKFGTLRVWIEGLDQRQQEVVDDHEAMGQYTCEICGQNAEIRSLIAKKSKRGFGDCGYVITLCDTHFDSAGGPNVIEKRTGGGQKRIG